MIVLSTISSTLSDGLDPSELLYILGRGKVTGDRLPRFEGLVIGSTGTDSGLLTRVDDIAVGLLLFVCFLERLHQTITVKNGKIKFIFINQHTRQHYAKVFALLNFLPSSCMPIPSSLLRRRCFRRHA